MATYYVRTDGNNANAGTGSAAGSAWQTIGKALGASGIASGDTLHIMPGVYREVVTVAMTNPTAETIIRGDADGSIFGVPGRVTMTAFTTSDTTAGVASDVLDLGGRDYLTIKNMTFLRYNNMALDIPLSGANYSQHIRVTNCSFLSGGAGSSNQSVRIQVEAGVTSDIIFDGCFWLGEAATCINYDARLHSADYDIGLVVRNCVLMTKGSSAIAATNVGAGAGLPYGVLIENSSVFGAITTTTNLRSATAAVSVYGCHIRSGSSTGLSAATSGQITEDYNVISANTPRSNVTAGANSKTTEYNHALLHFGDEWLHHEPFRPFSMPRIDAPYVAFDGHSSPPATDLLGVTRPGTTYKNACGALEPWRAQKETGTVRTGSNGLGITGWGHIEFRVPVSDASTTISVYARFDSTYGTATAKPALRVIDDGAGVTTAVDTMTSAADTWEQLTLTFTPTRKGYVIVRFEGFSTAAAGKSFWDDWSVT